jgi:hypothetical protein
MAERVGFESSLEPTLRDIQARTALQERGSTRWFSLTDCELIADFDRPLPSDGL